MKVMVSYTGSDLRDHRSQVAQSIEQMVVDRISAEPNFDEVLKQNAALEQMIRHVLKRLIAEDEKAETEGEKQPSAGRRGEKVLENIPFYPVPQSISNEILELSESMNDAYLEKEADRVIEKEGGGQEDEVIKGSGDPWHSRLIGGLSKALFHSSEEEPPMPDEEFRAVFQKEIAERIYDHLAMLTRAGYEEGDEPFSIMDEFTRMMAGKLGLGLSRSENIGEELKHRAGLVLHKLAWDFQSWLILEHAGQYSAFFGEIYTSVPEKMPANGKLLVLAADVAPPLESLMEPARAREPQWMPIDDIFIGGTVIPHPAHVYYGSDGAGELQWTSAGELGWAGVEVPQDLVYGANPGRGHGYIAGPVYVTTGQGDVHMVPFSHGGIFTGAAVTGFQPSGVGDFMILRSAVRQVRHGRAILGTKVQK